MKEAGFDVIHVRVVRPDYAGTLTGRQQNHSSETSLDDMRPDVTITNNGELQDLFKTAAIFARVNFDIGAVSAHDEHYTTTKVAFKNGSSLSGIPTESMAFENVSNRTVQLIHNRVPIQMDIASAIGAVTDRYDTALSINAIESLSASLNELSNRVADIEGNVMSASVVHDATFD